jgi:oligopeptide/dipeptide ABC transporter ATP-binding protein
VAEGGPTRDVLDTPRHPYTRMLLACHPDRATDLAGIPGTVPAATAQPSGCRFHPRCPIARDACATATPPVVTEDDRVIVCPYHAEPLLA